MSNISKASLRVKYQISNEDPMPQIFPTSQNPLTNVEQEDINKQLKRLKRKETKIVFFGNTQYSIIGAQILHQTYPLSLVVTIPDRETGRKKTLTPSPVKVMAQSLDIPIIEASKLDDSIIEQISFYQPDFLVVEDYGLILPTALLEIAKFAPLNIHHSLLPKYRGPSPAPTAILNGEKNSGVTIIKMTNKVDAGEILAQTKYQLKNDETTNSLLTELNRLGGELIVSVINDYLAGIAQSKLQNDAKSSHTKFIKKEDGYFDLPAGRQVLDLEKLDRMIRAYYPWPNAWTIWDVKGSKGQRVKKIVKFLPGGMVQMEGKKPVSLKDFLNGYPEFPLKEIKPQQ